MTGHPEPPYGIKVVRIPSWAVPILVVLAIAFVIFAGLLSLTLLLFLVPVIVIAALVQRFFGFWSTKPVVDHEWTGEPRHSGRGQVIEADYEVVDQPNKPQQ